MIIDTSHLKFISLADVDGLSVRTVNALARAKIWTIGDLVVHYNSTDRLKHVYGLGAAGRKELEEVIPRIYPGFLEPNNDTNCHEVDVDCLKLILQLERTIESQSRRIEVLQCDVSNLNEFNAWLNKRIRKDEETIAELRSKLRKHTSQMKAEKTVE